MSKSQALSHYHDWLKDAHAMEKQAETMLEKMYNRLENYSDITAQIHKHIKETQLQQSLLENILDHHAISNSSVKDVMGKIVAMGQAVSGSFAEDEIVKGTMSIYVFENVELASYKSLIAAAMYFEDEKSVPILKQIYEQEMEMSNWILGYLPKVTQKFLTLSDKPKCA